MSAQLDNVEGTTPVAAPPRIRINTQAGAAKFRFT
jgi:hypothetical protein